MCILILLCILLSGCWTYSNDSQNDGTWGFHVRAKAPEEFIIRVPKLGDYPVPTNGVVKVRVSRKVHRWDLYCVEAIMMSHESTDVPHLYLMKGDKIIKTINTKSMHKQKKDDYGNVEIKVE
jgi:hypothetical protein